MTPLVLINAVGLTSRLLPHAPRLRALAQRGWVRPLREVVPAVTCTAQATLLTGQNADRHGIVANGWLWSDTPKPHYGADGSKVFGIHGTPHGLTERLEQKLGRFPFHTFWGPMAGLP